MATKAEKQATVEELVGTLNESGAVYLAEYTGMSVAEVSELRSEFRKEGINYKVYKNTLVKRAMEEVGGYSEAYSLLENQNGFAFVGEDLGKPAKILKEFIKSHNDRPKFKGAVVDGTLFDENQLDALASLKSKNELIGDILGLLMAPINNVVGALQAQGSNVVGAIKTIAEKEEN